MFDCSYCGKEFVEGGLCEKCGRVFCPDHTLCPLCNINLKPIYFKKEAVYNYPIVWLISESKTIGLADFENPPKELPIILNLPNFPEDIKLILFSSKNSSKKFINSAESSLHLQYQDNIPYSEKSRYTIIKAYDGENKYILLNSSAITPDQFKFILDFLIKCFKYAEFLKDTDLLILKNVIGQIFFEYNKKIGLSFVSADEYNKKAFHLIIQSVATNYYEYLALKDLINLNNLSMAGDFIKYKINLNFEKLFSEKPFTFLDVLSIINYYIFITVLKQIASSHIVISNEIIKFINILHKKYIIKLEENKDLHQILNNIINKNEIPLNNLEEYSIWVSNILSESIKYLEPKYDISREIIDLFKISEIYINQLKQGIDIVHPYLGTSENYTNTMTKICKKENVNSQIRIIAGQAAINILIEKIVSSTDYLSYLNLVDISFYMTELIEQKVPELNEKANILQFDKIIGYHDAINCLLVLSSFAEQLNDKKNQTKSEEKALKLAQKYNVMPYIITVTWKKYIKSHDLELLKYVHKNFSLINDRSYNYIEPYTMLVGHLSNAVIENRKRKENINIAKEWCNKIFDPELGDLERSMHSLLLYSDILNIFECVLKALKNDIKSSLELAKKYISSIFYEATEKEPLKSFALKTQILIDFISKDEKSFKNNYKLLKNLKSKYISEFLEKMVFWIEQKKLRQGRLFTLQSQIIFDRDLDPWEKVMMKFIEHEMYLDLQQNIINVDAFIRVEGLVDKYVLENFFNKINPNKNIYLEEFEGFSNVIIAQKESKIPFIQKIPIYCILDGDVKLEIDNNTKKGKIIKEFIRSSNEVFILKKSSIESYLLIPRAIKAAFPSIKETEKDIEKFLDKRKNRKNKKIVLDELLKKYGVGKYNKEKALLISKEINKEEIDPELFNIISAI